MNRGRVLKALSRPQCESRPIEGDAQTEPPASSPPTGDRAEPHQQQHQSPQRRSPTPQVQSTSRPSVLGIISARGRKSATSTHVSQLQGRLSAVHVSSGGDEPEAPPSPETHAQQQQLHQQPESGNSSPTRGLSRQDSNASRSSALSQQFTSVNQPSSTLCLPKEPSTAGAAIQVGLNYMTFNTDSHHQIEEYHVNFSPDIESIRLRSKLLHSEEARAIVGQVLHWNGTNLYLPLKLPNRISEFTAQHPSIDSQVDVRITHVKTPNNEDLLPFYNSLMHKVMTRLKYVVFNRQHYSPDQRIAITQHKLEVWPGWITSIQKLDGGIKLSVDASFKVVRLETVRDILVNIRNNLRGIPLRDSIESALVGSVVMTKYNNKAYRIDGVDTTKNPSHKFKVQRTNQEISMVDYMREHWNLEVQDRQQPLLIHKPKPKYGVETEELVYLIPELCVTTGLTEEMRANFSIMKAVGDHTRLPPEIRERKLTEFLHQLATDERAATVLKQWNLSVRPELDVVQARRLDCETVLFGNKATKVPDNADWTRPATGGPVYKSVDINEWVIMFCEKDSAVVEDLMAHMKEVSRILNIKFNRPRLVKLPNEQSATYVNYGRSEVKATDQMVVILTPGKTKREDRYSACKRLFSCEKPVPCQFIRCGTIADARKIRSVCQKVVIQILSKVGGQPWAMRLPIKAFMVIGIDTYHDTIDRKNSCVGFVASMNDTASSWWSHGFFQHSLEEIAHKINTTMVAAVRKFHQLNGILPERIIVYRDGVGDSQLSTVLAYEVAQVIDGLKFYVRDNHSPDQAVPKISYLIVQKRINTKISLRSRGQVLNPLPGSYVDHSITHPDYNDFYLISQHVNQGTVSPTKYILIKEEGTLKLEHHQKMAYKMTHMYFNWCGTVRVPAPCQYAHKLAYLSGETIKQQVSECLEDKLYYL